MEVPLSKPTYAMPLLEEILQQAQILEAGDLHLIGPRGQKHFTVHFRSQRCLIRTESYSATCWSEVVEQIKFQSGYRSDRRLEFQDAAFQFQSMAFRVAFTPYPCDYLTLRRHDLQTVRALPASEKKSCFLQLWAQDFKILLVGGQLHSGKTTYYYDILTQESAQNRTILSLEDPIEKPTAAFFQLPIHQDLSASLKSALLRFDPDVIGLGELRRDQDWDLLHFLALSSIRSVTTCHGASFEAMSAKISQALMRDRTLKHTLFGAIFLSGFSSPAQYYRFEENHERFVCY